MTEKKPARERAAGRWGKAGVRLTDKEIEERGRAAVAYRNQRDAKQLADDRIAYRLWLAGELKPYLITMALDARRLVGPEVDEACGAKEPDVDLWEAGKLYPTWRQLLLLCELTGKTPRWMCSPFVPLDVNETSLRFHVPDVDAPPKVWVFEADVVRDTVKDAPMDMPEDGGANR